MPDPTTQQGLQHAAMRAITGTTGTWNEDFIRLHEIGGVAIEQTYGNGLANRRWILVDESYVPDA